MRSILDLKYKGDLCLDLYLPDSNAFDLLVYFHGGGFCEGSRKEAVPFAKTLSDNNIAIASIEYRMYPDAKFPEFIEDSAYSVRWILDHISEWGSCERVFVGGTSAGGYASMLLCFDKRYFEAVGVDSSKIAGYIHNAGQPTAHFKVLEERGIDSRRVIIDDTAPLFFVGMDKEYPPMAFIVADNDIPGRYEQTLLTVKTLESFGHKDGISLTVMPGTHTNYVDKIDDAGNSIFGTLIVSLIDKIRTV